LGLGGGEEEGLAGLGEVGEEGGEGAGEAHVEDTVGFVEDLGGMSLWEVRGRDEGDSPRIWRLSAANPTVWSMCCSNRPGVATRMFIRDRRSLSSLRFFPPITNPAEKE